jgi:uncharacterized protein (TIGR03437 family)
MYLTKMNIPWGLLTCLLIAPSLGFPQAVITTVAGDGSTSFSGAKVTAVNGHLNGPDGLFVDAAGNLYIADQSNFAVRKVDKSGAMTTIAGCGPDITCLESGPFLGGSAVKTSVNPYGIVVDKAGNVYITDGSRNAVEKIDTGGIITAFAGTGKPSANLGDGGPANKASLNTPVGLDIDSAGNIYIADLANNRIRKVDTAGIITTVAGSNAMGFGGDGGKATDAMLNNPHGVAVDKAGNIYIADTNNFVVRKVNASGIITTLAGLPGNPSIIGPAPEGTPAINTPLVSPWDVRVDSVGNLYIAEWLGFRVRKVDQKGIITTVAGDGKLGFSGDGGLATSAMLTTPEGIRLDAAGNLYIADNQNNRVRKVGQPHAAPVVNALGVVNNASFAPGSNPVAPGSIAAVFGSNMNDGSNVLFSSFGADGKLVTTLGGAQVTINGSPVPIFYSTPAQLGIQIPANLSGSSASIQVSIGGETSAQQMIPIAPVAPGLFSTDQSGHGQGAILIANTNTLVAPAGSIPGRESRPAKTGDFITIFCTGLGAVTPLLATGEPGTSNTTVEEPSVTIDGIPAIVQFSGIAPGFVGLDQVNVEVPAGVHAANDVPVVLTIGGKQSNTVTIAVSGS